jgi:uncharacterized protein
MVKIPFPDISSSGSRYRVTNAYFLSEESDLHQILPVQAELLLQRKNDHQVDCSGSVHTGIRLTCDRCLADYDFPVATDFHFILECASEEATQWTLREIECSSAEIDLVHLTEPLVDVEDILRQQVYLSLPVKQICSPDCKGLCPKCGLDLNREHCTCPKNAQPSPFSVLAALKK